MMLFKPKDRANELKTPKIPKISLPDSNSASFETIAPIPHRRHSTISSRNANILDTPAGRHASLSKSVTLPAREAINQTPTLRGGPSYIRTRVSSVSAHPPDGILPLNKDISPILSRPSAMSRRASEAGGGPSRTCPKKSVNFAFDKSESKYQGDGYATDSGFSERSSFGKGSETSFAGSPKSNTGPPRPMSRRDVRVPGSSKKGSFEAAEVSKDRHGPSKKYDGYATDGDSLLRSSPTRSRHSRGPSLQTHMEAEPTSAKRSSYSSSPETPRRFSPRTEGKPPGLHTQLLADSSGRPHLRFNIIFPPARPYVKTWHDIPRLVEEKDLDEPATETDLTVMSILLHCDPLPPWERVIQSRKPVTCKDVFEAIWKEYDVELTDAERAKIPSRTLDVCTKGFKKRCKEVPVLTALEERCGLKRVDLLAGRTFFRGMTKPHPSAPWVVELQMPPRGYSS